MGYLLHPVTRGSQSSGGGSGLLTFDVTNSGIISVPAAGPSAVVNATINLSADGVVLYLVERRNVGVAFPAREIRLGGRRWNAGVAGWTNADGDAGLAFFSMDDEYELASGNTTLQITFPFDGRTNFTINPGEYGVRLFVSSGAATNLSLT